MSDRLGHRASKTSSSVNYLCILTRLVGRQLLEAFRLKQGSCLWRIEGSGEIIDVTIILYSSLIVSFPFLSHAWKNPNVLYGASLHPICQRLLRIQHCVAFFLLFLKPYCCYFAAWEFNYSIYFSWIISFSLLLCDIFAFTLHLPPPPSPHLSSISPPPVCLCKYELGAQRSALN